MYFLSYFTKSVTHIYPKLFIVSPHPFCRASGAKRHSTPATQATVIPNEPKKAAEPELSRLFVFKPRRRCYHHRPQIFGRHAKWIPEKAKRPGTCHFTGAFFNSESGLRMSGRRAKNPQSCSAQNAVFNMPPWRPAPQRRFQKEYSDPASRCGCKYNKDPA